MDYSQSEIDFMRKDALRRTREMHSHANNGKNNVQADNLSQVMKETFQDHKQEKNQKFLKEKSGNPLNDILSGLFSGEKIDNDKFIIIILIVILAKEGVDLKLLIALGYIIM